VYGAKLQGGGKVSSIKERAEECLNHSKKMRRKYKREKDELGELISDEFVKTIEYIITGRRKSR